MCFEEITPDGGGSVMFWAAINSMERTELVFIEYKTLNAHRYITAYNDSSWGRFHFMDHNARAHRSRDVEAYMRKVGIRRLDSTQTIISS